MSLSNVKEFKFVKFDLDNESNKEKELIKFKVEQDKEFKYSFEISDDKTEFSPMFVGGKKISYKEREEKLEKEFIEKRKKLEKELEELIQKKKEEAEKIIENAKTESEKIKLEKEKEGYNVGYEKGYKDGIKKGIEEEKSKFHDLSQIIDKLVNFEKENLSKYGEKISSIIIELSKKIIKKEIETYPEKVLKANIENILNKIVDKTYVKIFVSTKIYDFLNENIDYLKGVFNIENLKIDKMEKLEPADCIVETNYGTYDASIQEQIFEMEKSLLN